MTKKKLIKSLIFGSVFGLSQAQAGTYITSCRNGLGYIQWQQTGAERVALSYDCAQNPGATGGVRVGYDIQTLFLDAKTYVDYWDCPAHIPQGDTRIFTDVAYYLIANTGQVVTTQAQRWDTSKCEEVTQ